MNRLSRVTRIARESARRRRSAECSALLARIRRKWSDPQAYVEGNGSEMPRATSAAEAAHWYAVCVAGYVVATGPSRHAALAAAVAS